MNRFIISLLTIIILTGCGQSEAAVLGISPSGSIVSQPSLAACNTAANIKECRVTSPQVVTTAIVKASDREITFSEGGYVTFTGVGALTGLPEARPEYFGIDGTADEVQINQAIAAVSAAKGVVRLQTIYTIAAPVVLTSNVTLEGNGWGSGIIANTSTPFNRMITSSDSVQQVNITIRNMKVDRSGVGSQHGIIMGGVDGLLIENVWVYGYDTDQASGAIGISPFNSFADVESKNVTIQNCRIERANNFGVAFGFVTSGSILNNKFVDCYREAIGIESYDNGADATVDGNQDIIVAGNTISVNKTYETGDGSVGPAVLIGSAGLTGRTSGVIFTHNTIDCGDLTGTDANGTPLSTYNGIHFIGGITGGTSPSGNVVITENIIRNTPAVGIAVGGSGAESNNTIIGSNIIINSGTGGEAPAINVGTADKTKIFNNIVRGTTHSYIVREQNMSAGFGSDIVNNYGPNGTLGRYLLAGQITTLLDPGVFRSATSANETLPVITTENITIADDATATFTARGTNNRAVYILSTSYGEQSVAIFTANSTSAPITLASGSLVEYGTANPDTDGKVNIWPASATRLSIKNRLGSSRTFTLFSVATQ